MRASAGSSIRDPNQDPAVPITLGRRRGCCAGGTFQLAGPKRLCLFLLSGFYQAVERRREFLPQPFLNVAMRVNDFADRILVDQLLDARSFKLAASLCSESLQSLRVQRLDFLVGEHSYFVTHRS